ncbi:MAG TPA: response regulator [bacterium]
MRKRILFVDDDDNFLKGLRRSLHGMRAEWDLNFALSSEEVLANLSQQQFPDLIVCDLMMPGLSGFELLERLRSKTETEMIPFMFLTGQGDKSSFRHGMALGADDFLTKPFETPDLIQAIRVRLEKKEKLSKHTEQKLSELRDSIVLAMPHELRTPLTVIQGFSEYLLSAWSKLQPDELKEMVQHIQDSSRRLNRIIENYLTYIRIDLFSANHKIANMVSSFRIDFPGQTTTELARQIASSKSRAEDLFVEVLDVPLNISEEDYKKIVVELTDNAFKFSNAGSPVRISASLKNQQFLICFHNEGVGMTQQQIAELGAFRQFNRRVQEQQGAGLGLIIAKRLAELYGGKLTIKSVANKCVEVQVTIDTVDLSGANDEVRTI